MRTCLTHLLGVALVLLGCTAGDPEAGAGKTQNVERLETRNQLALAWQALHWTQRPSLMRDWFYSRAAGEDPVRPASLQKLERASSQRIEPDLIDFLSDPADKPNRVQYDPSACSAFLAMVRISTHVWPEVADALAQRYPPRLDALAAAEQQLQPVAMLQRNNATQACYSLPGLATLVSAGAGATSPNAPSSNAAKQLAALTAWVTDGLLLEPRRSYIDISHVFVATDADWRATEEAAVGTLYARQRHLAKGGSGPIKLYYANGRRVRYVYGLRDRDVSPAFAPQVLEPIPDDPLRPEALVGAVRITVGVSGTLRVEPGPQVHALAWLPDADHCYALTSDVALHTAPIHLTQAL